MNDEMELAGCTYAWTGRTTHLLEGTRLTELGLYMEVMHIASGALETAFCLRIGVGWARTYHAAHHVFSSTRALFPLQKHCYV
jgi:hypothetical protein